MKIAGSVALVTGAAAGIGLATARRFAESGARVVLSDIQREKGETAAAELREAGREAEFVYADVGDSDSINSLFQRIEETYGELQFAFNNAGVEGIPSPLDTSDDRDWDRVIAVNLSSIYRCMKHEIRMMKRNGEGVIINCASVAGLVGTRNGAIYCASKHGVVGITRAAALDFAREKIRINAVCPGAIETEMVQRAIEASPEVRTMIENLQPIGRMGSADEIASAVLWLCQPEAALVTGAAFALDGGWTAQ
jgi:NAD(P)-dependent dehydrogenase (short-subunit alcohol dehydrogenase family)